MVGMFYIILLFVAVLALCGVLSADPESEWERWKREQREERRQALWHSFLRSAGRFVRRCLR